jgi:transaldolase
MYRQGRWLASLADNAVVKVPMTPEGLKAGSRLVRDGVRINVTLVFSPAQAILAARIGAYVVSPFIGRIDDSASDGLAVLRQICRIFHVQGYETQVLAASLRHPMHVVEAALAGADIATMPYEVFTRLVGHPLTDLGLRRFQEDWEDLQRRMGSVRSVGSPR